MLEVNNVKLVTIIAMMVVLITSSQVLAMSGTPQDEKYEVEQHQDISNLEYIRRFEMPELYGLKRKVWIYLPADYKTSDKNYPVLYMHDGQNLFENDSNFGSWRVDESINELFKQGKIEGVIVVAVSNGSSRSREYAPYDYWLFNDYIDKTLGDKYIEFIVNTLKPYVDNNYRTKPSREHTAMAGSSLGGLISLYGGLKYQDVFSKIGAFSPYLVAPKGKIDKMYQFVEQTGKNKEMQIYLDVGTKEFGRAKYDKKYEQAVIDMHDLLKEAGFAKSELKLVVEEEGIHNERYWAKRFPDAFLWWFSEE